MPRNTYEPLKLNQTNRYAGYQFHARVRVDGMDAASAFRFLILSVYHWIRSRVPEEDRGVPELALPEAEEYGSVEPGAFLPYHFSVGYSLDITPLVEDGIWALRLKEPDIGTAERNPVSGRFFTTRVGLRLSDKGYTELGIRIDVTDPASAEKEVDFAFRPGFVRSLAIQPSVCFEHVREMGYGCPLRVTTPDEYKKFLFMLDNEDNQLPIVVFTHYRPGEKKAPSVSMEDFIKSEPVKSFLQSAGMSPGILKKKEIPLTAGPVNGMPELSPNIRIVPGKPEKVKDSAAAPVVASHSVPVADPVLLHDAEAFSRSAFGYAWTAVLGDSFFEKFAERIRRDIRPGDIVLCGARKFRGGVSVIGTFTGDSEEELRKVYDAALLSAQSYSKHKASYDYGAVVFEAEARKMEQQARVMELVNSGSMEDKEKISRLQYEMEMLFNVIDDKDDSIEELKRQKDEAYDRGVDFGEQENARLEEENSSLKKELAEKQDLIDQMLGDYQRAKDILGVVERMRKVDALPVTNEDVVRFFTQVYPDRLVFTRRGETEASRCRLRADHLWEILYLMANDLTDMFRSVQGNLTEEDVMKVMGCEISFQEGSMTRKDSTMMRLRNDEYEGKAISVEPHLKLKSVKGEPGHQRLHFCYDPELKKIIIGYVGDHLDSAASRYVGQR